LEKDNFRWLLTGYYLVQNDDFCKYTLFNRFVTKSKIPTTNQMDHITKSLVASLNKMPYSKWVKDCQAHADRDKRLEQVFNSVEDAAKEYNNAFNASELTVKVTPPLKILLEMAYSLAQRLVVYRPAGGQSYEYTSFGDHLRSNTRVADAVKELIKEYDNQLKTDKDGYPQIRDICSRILNVMKDDKAKKDKKREAQIKEMQASLDNDIAPMSEVLGKSATFNERGGGVLIASPERRTDKFQTDLDTIVSKNKRLDLEYFAPEIKDGEAPDKFYYASLFMEKLRKKGANVVVLVRRSSDYTTDPLDWELPLLEEFAKDPNVATCVLLWQPPDASKLWPPAERSQGMWRARAGKGIDLRFKNASGPDWVGDFVEDLVVSVGNCREQRHTRITAESARFATMVDKFVMTAKEQVRVRTQCRTKRPDACQAHLVAWRENNKDNEKAVAKELKKDNSAGIITLPGYLLNKEPKFSGEVISDLGGRVRSLNELECRTFVSNTLLVQTVTQAMHVARTAYDKVIIPMLDHLGDFFGMDAEAMLYELDQFCSQQKKVLHNEDWLRDFFRRDHFAFMFQGCVLYLAVPVLFGSVMPRISDGNDIGIKSSQYTAHIPRAIKSLNPKAEGVFMPRLLASCLLAKP
jgi:hypothetical protein